MNIFAAGVASGGLVAWLALLALRGQFWRSDCVLDPDGSELEASGAWPDVCAVVPARDEASVLSETLPTLLGQHYPGRFWIVLVDDRSSDGTGDLALDLAREYGQSERLTLVRSEALLPGWSGKLWAMAQGVRRGEAFAPEYWLFTDADIAHHPDNLAALVRQAQADRRDLVSQMVRLRCRSVWEVLLIPAFVFFFQKLYPFSWVNDPAQPTAAAAGGCILVRREALERAGGLAEVRGSLIDDCALAAAIQRSGGRLWLALSRRTRSLRPYPGLDSIWKMVARTAFTQLDYSFATLALTVGAMGFLYLAPPVLALVGLVTAQPPVALPALLAWLLMAVAYLPTLRFYEQPPWLALALPLIAVLYVAMTIDSAYRHWRGEGGAWKGRVYGGDQ